MKKDIYEFEVAKGFILSNIFAFVMICLSNYFTFKPGVLIYSEFVIIPIVVGIICAWSWKGLNMKRSAMAAFIS